MTRSSLFTRMQLPTACAFALLAAAAFAPSAQATCGDYLMPSGRHAKHQTSAPGEPAAPCHGPHCSQIPSAPVLPPAPPPTVAPVDWATLDAQLLIPADYNSRRVDGERAAEPIHHSDPIFHPPRTQA